MTDLLLPTFLHGPHRDVNSACRRAAVRVTKGAVLADLPESWVDVADMPRNILVEEPYRFPSDRGPNYHGYLLTHALFDAFDSIADPRWERVFDDMMTRPWLIYCCMGDRAGFLVKDPDRARPRPCQRRPGSVARRARTTDRRVNGSSARVCRGVSASAAAR